MSIHLHRRGIICPQAFTTDWKSAGTGANVDDGNTEDWEDTSNITASDDSRATTGTIISPGLTNILRATNFGFTTSDVPEGAVIVGIEVGIERRSSSNSGGNANVDSLVSLRTGSGQTGDNKADTETVWPFSDAEVIYGGEADDWSAGLTDSDIRSSDFGVDFIAENLVAFQISQPQVDHIRIRVHGATF